MRRPLSLSLPALLLTALLLAACSPAAPAAPTAAPTAAGKPAEPAKPAAAPPVAPPAAPAASPAAPAPAAPAAPAPAAPAAPAPAAPAAPAPAAPAAPPAAAASPQAAAPAAKPATPQQLTTVSFSIVSWNANYYPLIVAIAKNLMEQQGIKLDIVLSGSSVAGLQSVIGGSTQLGFSSPDAVILAAEKGADVVMVSGGVNKPHFVLVAQPEIQRPEDLKGKVLAAAALRGGGSSTFLRIMLDAHGLKDGSDYTIVAAGSTAERLTALKNKAAAGAAIFEPETSQLVDAGFHVVEKTTNILKEFQFVTVVSNRAWAKNNPDVVARFLKGFLAGTEFLYDPKNKTESIKILAENLKVDEKYAKTTYESYVEDMQIYPKDGGITVPGMKAVIQSMIDLGDIQAPGPDPLKYVDLTYLDRAKGSR